MSDRARITPAEIESTQDDLLAQLEELERRIEQALRDATGVTAAPLAE